MREFLDQLQDRIHSEHEDLLGKIRDGDWSDETQETLRKAVGDFADDFGYDLDEEGHALEDSDETTREQEGIRSSSDSDDDSDSDDGEERDDEGGDGEGGDDDRARGDLSTAPLPSDGDEDTDETEEAGAARAS